MRWFSDFPLEAKAAARFVEFFANCPDPVLKHTTLISSLEERIAWTILGTTMFQGLSYSTFDSLFSSLIKAFPEDKLWRTPVPRARNIEKILHSELGSFRWQLRQYFPGIFWSVGLFVRRHFPLSNWLSTRSSEELWRDLGEIYFMGKQAARPKVCATIYRLISPMPYGLGLSCKQVSSNLPLPLSLGARRYLAFMGPAQNKNFSEMSPKQKQDLANNFFTIISPNLPIAASHAFQFFWESGAECFICREFTRNCKNCPLQEFCKEASE